MKVHNGTYYNTQDLQDLVDEIDNTLIKVGERVPSAKHLVASRNLLVGYSRPTRPKNGVPVDDKDIYCSTLDDAKNIKLNLPTREAIFVDGLERLGLGGDVIPSSQVFAVVEEIVGTMVNLVKYSIRNSIMFESLNCGFAKDDERYLLPEFCKEVAKIVLTGGQQIRINEHASVEDRLTAQLMRAQNRVDSVRNKLEHHIQKARDYEKLHAYHREKTTFHSNKLTKLNDELAQVEDKLRSLRSKS